MTISFDYNEVRLLVGKYGGLSIQAINRRLVEYVFTDGMKPQDALNQLLDDYNITY